MSEVYLTISQEFSRVGIIVEQDLNKVILEPVLVVHVGAESEGGDMYKAVYDPLEKNADAFQMDNMDNATLSKTVPVDTDEFSFYDVTFGSVFKKITWFNIKAVLKTYFDGLYGFEDLIAGRAEWGSTQGVEIITLDIDGWSHKDYRIVNDTDLIFPNPALDRSYVRNMIVYNSAGPELTIIEGENQTLRIVGEYDNTVHVRNLLTIEASNTSTDGINITVYINHETI